MKQKKSFQYILQILSTVSIVLLKHISILLIYFATILSCIFSLLTQYEIVMVSKNRSLNSITVIIKQTLLLIRYLLIITVIELTRVFSVRLPLANAVSTQFFRIYYIFVYNTY